MRKTRTILVVAFVATALAADRLVAAAPVLRTGNIAMGARQLAGRLAGSFRRVVAMVRFQPFRRDERPADDVPPLADLADLQIHPCQFHSFQFRLPPPLA
jgi:hypothetical protein